MQHNLALHKSDVTAYQVIVIMMIPEKREEFYLLSRLYNNEILGVTSLPSISLMANLADTPDLQLESPLSNRHVEYKGPP